MSIEQALAEIEKIADELKMQDDTNAMALAGILYSVLGASCSGSLPQLLSYTSLFSKRVIEQIENAKAQRN